jgi:hypothetical protein
MWYLNSVFFFRALGFELRASHLLGRHSCCLSHSASPCLHFFFFWDRVSQTIYSCWLSNRGPADLCLLGSQNYRHEPLAPSTLKKFEFDQQGLVHPNWGIWQTGTNCSVDLACSHFSSHLLAIWNSVPTFIEHSLVSLWPSANLNGLIVSHQMSMR